MLMIIDSSWRRISRFEDCSICGNSCPLRVFTESDLEVIMRLKRYLSTAVLLLLVYFLGSHLWQEAAIDKAVLILKEKVAKRSTFVKAFGKLPPNAQTIVIDGWFGTKASNKTARAKFAELLDVLDVKTDSAVILLSYTFDDAERTYTKITLTNCPRRCGIKHGLIEDVSRDEYVDGFSRKGSWVDEDVTVLGRRMTFAYSFRENKNHEIVSLQASVLVLPRHFLDRWVRQLEQTTAPYYKAIPVYEEFVPIGYSYFGKTDPSVQN